MSNINKIKGRIGILTGGGDVPGLNPAIRGVAIRAIKEGYEVFGLRRGWAGISELIRDEQYDNSNNFIRLTEEVVVSYFVDEKDWKRHSAVFVFGGVTFLIGIPSALSFNVLDNFLILGLNFFDLFDFITANLMLPLGGMLISIFVAWIWGFDKSIKELKLGADSLFENYPVIIVLWKIFVKYFAPILIFLVLLNSLGVL